MACGRRHAEQFKLRFRHKDTLCRLARRGSGVQLIQFQAQPAFAGKQLGFCVRDGRRGKALQMPPQLTKVAIGLAGVECVGLEALQADPAHCRPDQALDQRPIPLHHLPQPTGPGLEPQGVVAAAEQQAPGRLRARNLRHHLEVQEVGDRATRIRPQPPPLNHHDITFKRPLQPVHHRLIGQEVVGPLHGERDDARQRGGVAPFGCGPQTDYAAFRLPHQMREPGLRVLQQLVARGRHERLRLIDPFGGQQRIELERMNPGIVGVGREQFLRQRQGLAIAAQLVLKMEILPHLRVLDAMQGRRNRVWQHLEISRHTQTDQIPVAGTLRRGLQLQQRELVGKRLAFRPGDDHLPQPRKSLLVGRFTDDKSPAAGPNFDLGIGRAERGSSGRADGAHREVALVGRGDFDRIQRFEANR
ncbi:MAG: hypothetical protein BWZ08_02570 [candidate division BRC1 bacterium ADurb.BinA292]|nr:MAG: hypothetical protein BWZ08_02570 [candidate division BRC1 bacterium ADurb.BinA292]